MCLTFGVTLKRDQRHALSCVVMTGVAGASLPPNPECLRKPPPFAEFQASEYVSHRKVDVVAAFVGERLITIVRQKPLVFAGEYNVGRQLVYQISHIRLVAPAIAHG